jgi:hypothetical protein
LEAADASDLEWFAAVDWDTPLQQGDLLRDCAVPVIQGDLPVTREAAAVTDPPEIDYHFMDLMVISQSCDITMQRGRPRRVEQILVCPAWTFADFRATYPEIGRDTIRNMLAGRMPLWHVLAPCNLPELQRGHTFLEFRRIMSLPDSHLDGCRNLHPRRLRLRSPWLEHMAYAAGYLIGRPAIPTEPPPIPDSEFVQPR